MKNKKGLIILAALVVLAFAAVFGGITLTSNIGKTDTQVSTESAGSLATKLKKRITIKEAEEYMSSVDLLNGSDLASELPEFDPNSAAVRGSAAIDLCVFASPEKAGDGNDALWVDLGKKFNQERFEVNGQTVSVSVYNITSGLGLDYIVSGVKVPDISSPSSEYWGRMTDAHNVEIELIEKRMAGNVAGMVIKNEKYDEIEKEYGAVNVSTVTKAIAEGKLVFGYTTPNTSSTGLDYVMDSLYSFDSANPLSVTAIEGFNGFQKNIPFVANVTMQMKQAAASGSLDGFVYESQQWENSPELKGSYKFVPYGIRHDNPVYFVGGLSGERREAAELFVEYCKSDEANRIATKYGFNTFDDYSPEYSDFSGETLIAAQKVWKENKDVGKDIVAVFVGDISISMDGEPLNMVKKALVNGMNYINENNRVGLVTFSTDVTINLPIAPFDLTQKSKFKGAVENLSSEGNTATCDALVIAIDMILEDQKTHPGTKPMIFLLADGGLNHGYDLRDIKPLVEASGIPIYGIGYNTSVPLLDSISEINEASVTNAESGDVVYKIRNLFNSNL